MSFVLSDVVKNCCLAVVADGLLAGWLIKYYSANGITVAVTSHDSVLCETLDNGSEPFYVFDI